MSVLSATVSGDARVRQGILLVLTAALFYGFGPPLARLAYDGGITPINLLCIRFALMALVLVLVQRLRHRSLRVPPASVGRLFGLGLLFATVGGCYLSAVNRVPVALAALLFFTYPAMTMLLARVIGGERFTLPRLVAFTAVFAGIALALGIEAAPLDPAGVALALAAAACCALTLTLNARVRQGLDGLTSQFYVMLPGAALFGTLALLVSGSWPTGTSGWLGLAGTLASFTVGTICFFAAIPRAGPVRAALFGNLEPVITLAAAPLLLGEVLAPAQLAGAGLVVIALLTLPLVEFRRKKLLATQDLVS